MLEICPPSKHRTARTVVVIDNYDSFTFNLVQCLASLGARCLVLKNDEITLEELAGIECAGILLSPGPGRPEEAGITLSVPLGIPADLPLLGVCLGHQAIALAFGAHIVRAERPWHGKLSPIAHGATGLFDGLPSPLPQARYNSLTVETNSLPACLQVLATAEGELMAFKHEQRPIYGVQFHPESILSERGGQLLHNWLRSLS